MTVSPFQVPDRFKTRGLYLSRPPNGPLRPEHIETLPVTLPRHTDLLLRPRYLSVDPYMRTRMQPQGYGYISRWQAGSALSGWTLIEVRESTTSLQAGRLGGRKWRRDDRWMSERHGNTRIAIVILKSND